MNITDGAKQKLGVIFKENGVEGIRLYSNGAGCCGPQLGLSLDGPKETDIIKEINGVRVAIDQEIKDSVDELTLDKNETPQGERFVLLGMDQCC